jgi:hypothetical protein
MLKRILTGVLLLGMVGAVIACVVALVDPSEHAVAQEGQGRGRQNTEIVSNGQGQGYGRGQQDVAGRQNPARGQDIAADEHSTAQGYGRGRQNVASSDENGQQGYSRGQNRTNESEVEHSEWQMIVGIVLETDELVIETSDGEIVQVGLGPSQYRESEGFALSVGDQVSISGYWEDDEFKAAQVENLSTGTQIVLRDSTGRPMWAGQGRRSG